MMNPGKRIYCRIFQIGMRITLPVLPYRNPKILDSVKDIPACLKEHHKQHPLLITDPFLYKSGMTKTLEWALQEADLYCTVYNEVAPNPTTINIADAYGLYKIGSCDCLIGFGGGSSIDCAKAVGAQVAHPHENMDAMSGILRVHKPTPLMLAIPTTAGTGSETTLAAVVTDAKTRHKYAINDFPLIPDYAVLDPENTRTLPQSLTSTTGMDALTHAIEAYIGRSTNHHTREEALSAVHLIYHNLLDAYNDGNDMHARKNMLKAAYLAGDAFSRSYVGYVHAVAHSLGGKYNVPHGLANAVLLPIILEAYGPAVYKKLHDIANVAGVCKPEDSDETAAHKMIASIRAYNKQMNIPSTLDCVQEKDIDILSHYADKEANPLYPVPILWDQNQLKEIYYMVMNENYAKQKEKEKVHV